jgi:hypothetical protein
VHSLAARAPHWRLWYADRSIPPQKYARQVQTRMARLTRNDKLALTLTEWLEQRLEEIHRVADGIQALSKHLEKT